MAGADSTTLWLVRHAQPLVEAGMCYGQLDLAADPAATLSCATGLANALPDGIQITCSTLQRCEQLAQVLIGLRPDLAHKSDDRLQEMNFGQWEGQPWAAIPRYELDHWTDHFASCPAGQSGESVSMFMQRVASAFDAITPGVPTLWITHAGVIRAAGLIAAGTRCVTRADQWPLSAPAYGQWCKLKL
jgi:alpha-ribazole phosphatase